MAGGSFWAVFTTALALVIGVTVAVIYPGPWGGFAFLASLAVGQLYHAVALLIRIAKAVEAFRNYTSPTRRN